MSRFSAAGPASNKKDALPKTDPGKIAPAASGDGFKRTGAVVSGTKTGVDPGKSAPASTTGEGFRRTGSTQNSTPNKTTGREFQGVGEQAQDDSAKVKPIADDEE